LLATEITTITVRRVQQQRGSVGGVVSLIAVALRALITIRSYMVFRTFSTVQLSRCAASVVVFSPGERFNWTCLQVMRIVVQTNTSVHEEIINAQQHEIMWNDDEKRIPTFHVDAAYSNSLVNPKTNEMEKLVRLPFNVIV